MPRARYGPPSSVATCSTKPGAGRQLAPDHHSPNHHHIPRHPRHHRRHHHHSDRRYHHHHQQHYHHTVSATMLAPTRLLLLTLAAQCRRGSTVSVLYACWPRLYSWLLYISLRCGLSALPVHIVCSVPCVHMRTHACSDKFMPGVCGTHPLLLCRPIAPWCGSILCHGLLVAMRPLVLGRLVLYACMVHAHSKANAES